MSNLLFEEWDNQPPAAAIQIVTPPKPDNPCITLYGNGPEDARCKDCCHLLRLRYHDKTYIKCEMRKITHGAGSDHRAGWLACGKFESEEVTV
jgi:hypothetical protein